MNATKKNAEALSEIDAQSRLAAIMNDSPTLVKLANTEWAITALKPGVQWLIAEESTKIQKAESSNFSDVFRQLCENLPAMWHIMTLALLNDRDLIFVNERKREYTELYHTTYSTLKWETKPEQWLDLMVEVMRLINIEVFFCTTKTILMIREMALARKKTVTEQKLLSQEQSGGK